MYDADRLEHMALHNAQRLLRLLPLMHPSVDMARNTALRLTCPTDGLRIVADGPDTNGDGNPEPDTVGTKSLDDMWEDQPSEVGGSLRGLATQLMDHLLFNGMIAVEQVPGPPLAGVRRVIPIDTLTLDLWRPSRDSDLELRQAQVYKTGDAWKGQWQDLPPDRVRWAAADPEVDNPHGHSQYAVATNEILADLALIQDLRDAVHNAAWPRVKVGVDLANLHRVAVEVYKMRTAKEAAEWVTERFNDIKTYVENLGPADNIVHDASGKAEDLKPGSFQGLEGVLSFLRQRLAQSLKTLPTLLGINDGSTFNYTSVEWAIYAQGLETLRSVVAEVLVWVANMHLRLTGSKSRARAVTLTIRTNDAQVEANTESTKITNATNLEKLGYLTHDQASQKVTGRKAAAEAQPGVVKPLPQAPAVVPGNPGQGRAAKRNKAGSVAGTRKQGKPGPKKLPQNPNSEGTTKEERNAQKARPRQ